MRRILVCSGVLGGGTALVFALAAATAMLFPQGTLVSGGWNGNGNVMFGKPVNAFGARPMMIDVMSAPTVEAPAISIPKATP